MKIELVEGCIADSLDIDGKAIYEYSTEELKDVLTKATAYAVNKAEEGDIYNLQTAIRYLVEMFGNYKHSEDACECCGDFIDTYTMEI